MKRIGNKIFILGVILLTSIFTASQLSYALKHVDDLRAIRTAESDFSAEVADSFRGSELADAKIVSIAEDHTLELELLDTPFLLGEAPDPKSPIVTQSDLALDISTAITAGLIHEGHIGIAAPSVIDELGSVGVEAKAAGKILDTRANIILQDAVEVSGKRVRVMGSEGEADDLPPEALLEAGQILNPNGTQGDEFLITDEIDGTNLAATNNNDEPFEDRDIHHPGAISMNGTGAIVRERGLGSDRIYKAGLFFSVSADQREEFIDTPIDPQIPDDFGNAQAYMKAALERIAKANGKTLDDVEIVLMRRSREDFKKGILDSIEVEWHDFPDGTPGHALLANLQPENGKVRVFWTVMKSIEGGWNEAIADALYQAGYGAIGVTKIFSPEINFEDDKIGTPKAERKTSGNMARRYVWTEDAEAAIRQIYPDDAEAILTGKKLFVTGETTGTLNAAMTFTTDNALFGIRGAGKVQPDGTIEIVTLRIKAVEEPDGWKCYRFIERRKIDYAIYLLRGLIASSPERDASWLQTLGVERDSISADEKAWLNILLALEQSIAGDLINKVLRGSQENIGAEVASIIEDSGMLSRGTSLEEIRAEIIYEMGIRGRTGTEIASKLEQLESVFGVLEREALDQGLDPDRVIDAYIDIMREIASATIAGEVPAAVLQTMSEGERALVLPTNNVAETAHQFEEIEKMLAELAPSLSGRFGREGEVGHVDALVWNPWTQETEAKLTHPAAIALMNAVLASKGLYVDFDASNNGSGHGTKFDKRGLKPVSQVGKISPWLTREHAEAASEVGATPAQHGTSGSDMDELRVLAERGSCKFNIATHFQQTLLNVVSLLDDGIKGEALLEKARADENLLRVGLRADVREKIKELARAFKDGELTSEVTNEDSLFMKWMKLTYAWGLSKGKIKDTSDAEDTAVVLAKEFKRALKQMDGDFHALAQGDPQAQEAITYIIKETSQRYLQAVGATDTADLIDLSALEFAPGHDAFQALRKSGKATIAVNLVSYNQIEGHLLAAMEENAILIIEIARSQLGYALDEVTAIGYIREIVKKTGCSIPIVIHGDHIQYSSGRFSQRGILKSLYDKKHGKDAYDEKFGMAPLIEVVAEIDNAMIQEAREILDGNSKAEREIITEINRRLIAAGFTSIAIDASTIFDALAGEAVSRYYLEHGSLEEELVARLELEYNLPLYFGTGVLTAKTTRPPTPSVLMGGRDSGQQLSDLKNIKDLLQNGDEEATLVMARNLIAEFRAVAFLGAENWSNYIRGLRQMAKGLDEALEFVVSKAMTEDTVDSSDVLAESNTSTDDSVFVLYGLNTPIVDGVNLNSFQEVSDPKSLLRGLLNLGLLQRGALSIEGGNTLEFAFASPTERKIKPVLFDEEFAREHTEEFVQAVDALDPEQIAVIVATHDTYESLGKIPGIAQRIAKERISIVSVKGDSRADIAFKRLFAGQSFHDLNQRVQTLEQLLENRNLIEAVEGAI